MKYTILLFLLVVQLVCFCGCYALHIFTCKHLVNLGHSIFCPAEMVSALLNFIVLSTWTLFNTFPLLPVKSEEKCLLCITGETTMLATGLALHSMACCHGLRSTRFLFLTFAETWCSGSFEVLINSWYCFGLLSLGSARNSKHQVRRGMEQSN